MAYISFFFFQINRYILKKYVKWVYLRNVFFFNFKIILAIVNQWDKLKKTAIQKKKNWAFLGKIRSFEFLVLTLLIYGQKNFIPISIGFCVIPLQSYREILKKYRKRAITLQKTFLQTFEKNIFRYLHKECYSKVSKF